MPRTVVTKQDVERTRARRAREVEDGIVAAGGAPATPTPDDYRDRLLKYIPAEVVAIYLALGSLIKAAPPERTPVSTLQWTLFVVILVVTVPWQQKIMQIDKWQQVAIGSMAFVLWALSLGEPFTTSWSAWYQPLYGTMLLMLYTFLIPLFEPKP